MAKTKKDCIEEIISEHKFYVGVVSQGYASNFIQRFRAGQLKEKTVDAFLEKFGYQRIQEEQWGKAQQNQ